MGPARNRYWLPLGRLSAFFVAVVVVGNLVLHLVSPPPAASAQVQGRGDYFSRKKKKIERHLKAFERLLEGGFALPIPEAPKPAEPKRGAERPADPEPFLPGESGALRLPDPVAIASVEPEPPALLWPAAPPPASPREIDLPRSINEFHFTTAGPELVAEWQSLGSMGVVGDAADSLLRGPEAILDGILSLGSALFPRSGDYVWGEDEGEGITARILDLTVEARQGRIVTELVGRWMEREQRFFASFGESYLNTFDFEDGNSEMDLDDLMDEQRKILWDTVRKTYLSKYKFKAEERIRDDAFYFPEWRGVDFLVLPPLMAAYLYHRGLDKKISMGPTYVQITLEPLSKWLDSDEDLLAGLSVEWGVKGFPVGVIASAGLYDGAVELDFVGVGTSVGMVRKLLALRQGD